MIQELLGGASSSLLADPKISFNGPPPSHHAFQSCTSQPSSTPSSTTPTATATNNPPSSDDNNNNNSNNNSSNNNNNNLRCPRCDSANTKFCYYNNYNLTQPRHFCKTCRRYWTKGGALRNVPIGGGCRKNKSTIVSSTASKSTSASSKLSKPHDDIARAVTAGSTHLGFDHDLIIPNTYSSSNPNNILWGSASPQASSSSHILALLRATSQNPNPNPNHNPVSSHLVKEENNNMVAPHMSGQPLVLNGRAMGLDHLGHQVPSLGLSTPSFWRTNNQNQPQPHQNGTNIALGTDVHNSGMQELYQRLIRSSSSTTTTPTTNDYFTDHHHHHHSNSQPVGLMSNAISSSSSPPVSSMLESAPVASDQLGYGWNVNPAAFSWSDLPTTNGAYP